MHHSPAKSSPAGTMSHLRHTEAFMTTLTWRSTAMSGFQRQRESSQAHSQSTIMYCRSRAQLIAAYPTRSSIALPRNGSSSLQALATPATGTSWPHVVFCRLRGFYSRDPLLSVHDVAATSAAILDVHWSTSLHVIGVCQSKVINKPSHFVPENVHVSICIGQTRTFFDVTVAYSVHASEGRQSQ